MKPNHALKEDYLKQLLKDPVLLKELAMGTALEHYIDSVGIAKDKLINYKDSYREWKRKSLENSLSVPGVFKKSLKALGQSFEDQQSFIDWILSLDDNSPQGVYAIKDITKVINDIEDEENEKLSQYRQKETEKIFENIYNGIDARKERLNTLFYVIELQNKIIQIISDDEFISTIQDETLKENLQIGIELLNRFMKENFSTESNG